MDRKAKIVATIGPASQDEGVLARMIQAGMDVARLNFSHGNYDEHRQYILSLRKLSETYKKPITILQDLQGPKMRVGVLPAGGIPLLPGEWITLSPSLAQPEAGISIPLDVPDLFKSVRPGSHILMDDGKLEVVVSEAGERFIRARVLVGGLLKSHKGINFPGIELDISALTEKDAEDLKFGLENDVDMVAVSFVRGAKDIQRVRDLIQQVSPQKIDIPIIAKLERPEAIKNLDEILEISDGVMVARGDLAVETSPELVPVFQKQIIQAANRRSKIVVTATQMLESMIENPRPTRAEASDVANAIFDGSDAVMLSAETATGHFPTETIEMMDRIICEAEHHFCDWGACGDGDSPTIDDAASITRAARELAHDLNVSGIAVFTQTGRTALLMSKARPRVPILAFTPHQSTYQKLGVLWGVTPHLVPFSTSIETMLADVDDALLSSDSTRPGDQVIIISGYPVGTSHPPNFALLHTIPASG